ncbi:MBL fold metallo-hydrolase [Pueribacillus theae]|uniref:MBL fold metallo-hydrolase n=1 Tax=Pueribacillus theae TaxID=2171751 RepID=A0A2U1K4W7_9BACI|nr:MBL fold metallo-hydrolase [Pueribacillus theae]PWA12234.1 MBL fold metallo-hydrolase [Pueribacillus theae]
MMEVMKHGEVTAVKLTPHHRSVYFYVIDGMLIDTGPANSQHESIPFFQENEIDFVSLTHSHEDHCGLGAWLVNQGLRIYAHKKAVEGCSKPGEYPEYRQVAWGLRKEGFQVEPLNNAVHSRSMKWEIIETPGHADDHIVFYNRENGLLFSGDLFVAPKTKLIMRHESIPEMMNSINRVLAYDFEAMFCGHAGYVANGKQLLKRKLDDLEIKKEEILELYKKGYSITEIDQTLFPKNQTTIQLVNASEHEFSSEHIVRSMINGFAEIT